MNIERTIRKRGIESVLHFTTNRGLVGALAVKGLLSRRRLRDEDLLEYVLHVNAARRPEAAADFDKSNDWLDYVNLSISEINTRFLAVSRRWHNNAAVWWCVLEFYSRIMTHDGVYFATTNNSYDRCIRSEGVEGLESLFVERVERKADWSVRRRSRAPHLPTCEQAEVLYPKRVDVEYLRRVYVAEEEHHDIVGGWLKEFNCPGVEVLHSREKFGGCPN